MLHFEHIQDDLTTHGRLGRVETAHGVFETPAFMPVGTQGTVKGLWPGQVRQTGSEVILANTYHLMLRPGSALVAEMGGLHGWMRWDGPILTDSGGYQVFSLAQISRISEEGVRFRSHVDGAYIDLTPERSMQVQHELGADIIMAFDDCPPGQGAGEAGYLARVRQANERTVRWLERCVKAHGWGGDQALFGIVQGGVDLGERDWCLERVAGFDLPGYAIGGVAVGEGHGELRRVVEHVGPRLPADRPRYLMGVGYERDILAGVQAGVDMFDCVLPTRNGRSANAFTSRGQIRLRNARFRSDGGVLEAGCDCPSCAGGFSRSYIRHLFMSDEILGPVLLSLHNIRHFQRFMLDIRESMRHNDWSLIYRRWPVLSGGSPSAGRGVSQTQEG